MVIFIYFDGLDIELLRISIHVKKPSL